MAGEYSLRGTATLGTLAEVHDLFEGIAEPVSPQDLMLFETAIVEVIGNLIKHGRPPGGVVFELVLSVDEDVLVGVIDDRSSAGTPYLHHEMPDADDTSGRGLPLVHALVDEFTVEDVDGHHLWRLSRALP